MMLGKYCGSFIILIISGGKLKLVNFRRKRNHSKWVSIFLTPTLEEQSSALRRDNMGILENSVSVMTASHLHS